MCRTHSQPPCTLCCNHFLHGLHQVISCTIIFCSQHCCLCFCHWTARKSPALSVIKWQFYQVTHHPRLPQSQPLDTQLKTYLFPTPKKQNLPWNRTTKLFLVVLTCCFSLSSSIKPTLHSSQFLSHWRLDLDMQFSPVLYQFTTPHPSSLIHIKNVFPDNFDQVISYHSLSIYIVNHVAASWLLLYFSIITSTSLIRLIRAGTSDSVTTECLVLGMVTWQRGPKFAEGSFGVLT